MKTIRTEEAARLFGVKAKTIRRWCSERKIPYYKVNNQFIFNRAELLKMIESSKTETWSDG